MNDADLITPAALVDMSVDAIAKLVERADGLAPGNADAQAITVYIAMRFCLDRLYIQHRHSGIKLAVDRLAATGSAYVR
ncbi:hypothetical protein [Lichenicoccus roseus]|uniref:Uncharacterized protein n=1 Tax=Lichenicoccus roseus TaxID=2683649 RepID=A0A5R9J2F5_9PROT|nr:hypothetical protein [Lichenicoccus roseus]TLU71149.1 hypothetical protein FE263_18440 [Lichenicoccus roseus]